MKLGKKALSCLLAIMMIVTHNNAIRRMVDRVIIIKDGEISESSRNASRVPAAELTDL